MTDAGSDLRAAAWHSLRSHPHVHSALQAIRRGGSRSITSSGAMTSATVQLIQRGLLRRRLDFDESDEIVYAGSDPSVQAISLDLEFRDFADHRHNLCNQRCVHGVRISAKDVIA